MQSKKAISNMILLLILGSVLAILVLLFVFGVFDDYLTPLDESTKDFSEKTSDSSAIDIVSEHGDFLRDTLFMSHCGNVNCEVDKEENCYNCPEDCGCDETQCCSPAEAEFERGCFDDKASSQDETEICCSLEMKSGDCCVDSDCGDPETNICDANTCRERNACELANYGYTLDWVYPLGITFTTSDIFDPSNSCDDCINTNNLKINLNYAKDDYNEDVILCVSDFDGYVLNANDDKYCYGSTAVQCPSGMCTSDGCNIGDCDVDSECGTGEICTVTHECVDGSKSSGELCYTDEQCMYASDCVCIGSTCVDNTCCIGFCEYARSPEAEYCEDSLIYAESVLDLYDIRCLDEPGKCSDGNSCIDIPNNNCVTVNGYCIEQGGNVDWFCYAGKWSKAVSDSTTHCDSNVISNIEEVNTGGVISYKWTYRHMNAEYKDYLSFTKSSYSTNVECYIEGKCSDGNSCIDIPDNNCVMVNGYCVTSGTTYPSWVCNLGKWAYLE